MVLLVCCLRSNTIMASVLILYILKTPENLGFSGVFRGYKMVTMTRNRLMMLIQAVILCLTFRKFFKWNSSHCKFLRSEAFKVIVDVRFLAFNLSALETFLHVSRISYSKYRFTQCKIRVSIGNFCHVSFT